jgi:acyl-ACP thioesterase
LFVKRTLLIDSTKQKFIEEKRENVKEIEEAQSSQLLTFVFDIDLMCYPNNELYMTYMGETIMSRLIIIL